MTNSQQRLVNTMIDSFAGIYWTVIAIGLLGGVIAAFVI